MRRTRPRPLLKWWLYRSFVVIAAGGVFISAGCSDDDDPGATDAGVDTFVPQPPPTFTPVSPPPEGVDTTGRLGSATLVADIGSPTDGPSWRVADQTLYFTVPNQAPTLRRLSAGDGGVEAVADYDGGPPGPYGTASAGGTTLFATEPNAIAMLVSDPDGGGPTTVTRRTSTFGLLGDIAAEQRPDASTLAFFVDIQNARAYRFDPAGGANDLTRVFDFDAGRATAIAVGRNDIKRRVVYVAVSNPNGASATIRMVDSDDDGDGGVVGDTLVLEGVSPNGIAVDDQGYILVAWARGINVYTSLTGSSGYAVLVGSSPGLALAAAPTSLTFGGVDRKTLYVTTAAGKIYAVPSKVAGVLR